MGRRITWHEGQYGSLTGTVGTVHAALFTVTWRTQHGKRKWSLRNDLPGMQGLTAADDDLDALKGAAEAWLDSFIRNLGATWPAGVSAR
jgi:hypothetical protein